MCQVGSGNTATEPTVANGERAVGFTDVSSNSSHSMVVENSIVPSDDVAYEEEAEQPSKKRTRLNSVSSKGESHAGGRFNHVNIEDLVVLEVPD